MARKALHDGGVISVAGASTCVDDNVDCWQIMLGLPEGFAYQAFDVVTTDSVADNAGGYR